jgi:endo-1,4-beta-xylanase
MPSHAQKTVTGNDGGYYPGWNADSVYFTSYVHPDATGTKPVMQVIGNNKYTAKWGTRVPGGTGFNNNFTLGRGWTNWPYGNPTGVKFPWQIANIGYNCYAFSHNRGGGLSAYGWRINRSGSDYGSTTPGAATSPRVVEWYVKEIEGASKDGGTQVGTTYTSNGSTYKVYRNEVAGSPTRPTPLGTNQRFVQYVSIRLNPYVPGPTSAGGTGNATITVGNHYNAWSNRNMKLGSEYVDLFLLTESYGSNSSGEVDVTVWGW